MGKAAGSEAGVMVAPAVRDLRVLNRQLVEWLGRRMPQAREIGVENLAYPRGAGMSHETILFDAAWTEGGRRVERGLVVRIKPTSFTVYVDDMFAEQYQLMRLLHETGLVKVAEVLWFEEDPSILGAPFFVMEKLNGRVAVSVPSYMEEGWVFDASPDEREKLWRNGVAQLAAISRVPLSLVQFLARPGLATGLDQEWDRWRRFLAVIRAVRPLPSLDAAWKRLEAAWPKNQPPGLVWGDARIGNMMVDDNFEILAVMDWEQPSLGGALHDLAWWVFTDRMKVLRRGGEGLAGIGDREATLALWNSLTGISVADIEWYEAFAAFKMVCLSTHMADMKDQAPSDVQVASGLQYREMCKLLSDDGK